MKVGIIGSGEVARTLAAGFVKHGHEVLVGSRDAGKLAAWAAPLGVRVRMGSFADAGEFGDVVVLAVKGGAAGEALSLVGHARLVGKTVIDTCNPIAEAPPVNGVLQFFTGPNDSLLERLQRQVPGARFVKAFNSVGCGLMVDPDLPGRPSMFICGNDPSARKVVTQILDQFGWETEDMGAAEAARAIEPLCMLWCIPGFLRQDWSHAFKVLR